MSPSSSAAWTARGTAFLLWALAAASATFWALRLGGGGPLATLPAQPPRPVASVDPAALASLLGGVPAAGAPVAAAPSLASRFKLLGVVAGVRSGEGAAVIAVDGKAPRPYRVGAAIDEGVVLQSVHGRQAVLGAPGTGGRALVTLELPPQK
jgi:general secretion pathway protein C